VEPGDKNFLLKKNKNGWEISIPNLPADVYEFKFTRGGWDKVATGKSGAGLANNLVKLNGDTSLVLTVEAWQDNFAAKKKSIRPPKTCTYLIQLFLYLNLVGHDVSGYTFPPLTKRQKDLPCFIYARWSECF
jgi:nitrogen fixation protein